MISPTPEQIRERLYDLACVRPKACRLIHSHMSYWCDQCVMTAALSLLDQRDAEIAEYKTGFALCEVHTPDMWEGDGGCVICEAVDAEASLLRMTEERDQIKELSEKWRDVGNTEYSAWRSGADERYRWRSSTLAQCAHDLDALLAPPEEKKDDDG